MTSRLGMGGLAIPPPLLSRTYQVLSEGTAAAMQARKVSYVAFPFPLRQLLAVLLAVFLVRTRGPSDSHACEGPCFAPDWPLWQ